MRVQLVGGPYDGEVRDISDETRFTIPTFPAEKPLDAATRKLMNVHEYIYVWGRHPVTGERCLVFQEERGPTWEPPEGERPR